MTMTNPQNGIVRPLRSQRTPRLGPLAIVTATVADFQDLQKKLSLPDARKLYLSSVCFDAGNITSPALVGPVMGAPYAVMVLETLRVWGVQSFLFMGWCGSICSNLRNGDILLPDSAVIDEGTSLHYGQSTGGIVQPDIGLHNMLRKAVEQSSVVYNTGRVWSTDGIFRETPTQIKIFQKKGALAVEMELSALCSAARFYSLGLAAVLVVSDELYSMQWRPGFNETGFRQSRSKVCSLFAEIERSLDDGYRGTDKST